MKIKKATILMSVLVMLLSLTMAVSCNQNVAGEADRLVRVSLADGSRGLSYQVVDNSKNVDDLYWYYSATKGAGYFKTGETAWAPITKTAAGTLEGSDLGLFSQGEWTFTFWGFDTEQSRTEAPDITPGSSFDPKAAGLYYYAVGVAKTLSEDEEYLDITLTPGFAIETKVIFQNLVFDPDQYIGVKTSGAALTLKAYEGGVEYLDFGTVSAVEGVYTFASTAVEKTYTSDFGYHDLAFTVTCGTEEVASEELRIYVREGLVTTITGDLSSLERRSDVVIKTVKADKITYNATATVEAGVEKSIALDDTGNSVSFPADTLSAGSVTLTVDKKDAGSFEVASGETGILALDLSAAQTDGIKSQFAAPVLVSWYIGEGYDVNDLEVVYTGDSTLSQPTIVSYVDGVLTFSTDHFSEFVVKINGVALLNRKAYNDVNTALNAAKDGEKVILLKDVTANGWISVDTGKAFTLDLGGNTLTAGFDIYNASISLLNGTVKGTIYLNGAAEASDEFKSKLVVGAGACVSSNYAVILYQNADGKSGYGIDLEVNGKIDGMIWVMGNITEGDSVVTLGEDARIVATKGPGIALNGKAKVTVEDGAEITGSETAIEVRSGELVVNGGTFRSTSTEFFCEANGSGTTTYGAALAIAQHTTKKDIKVTVNGGTFEGIVGLNESNPQHNDPAPKVTLALNGGTFKSTRTGGIAVCIVDTADTTTSASVVYNGKKYIGSDSMPAFYAVKANEAETFDDFQAAVTYAGTDETQIAMLKSSNGNGVKFQNGQKVTIDFGTYTYTIDGLTVGSAGTETLSFQLNKGAEVTLKNGALRSAKAKMMLQNYCDLTLIDMDLDCSDASNIQYVASNNFGSLTVKGKTIIKAAENRVAFDVWYGMNAVYDDGVNVVFDSDFTGTVSGKVEFGAAGRISASDFKNAVSDGKVGIEVKNCTGSFNVTAAKGSNFDFHYAADWAKSGSNPFVWN